MGQRHNYKIEILQLGLEIYEWYSDVLADIPKTMNVLIKHSNE